MQTTDCKLQIGFKMQTSCKKQTADDRLSFKCRLRPKLSHRLISDIFSMHDLRAIILRDFKLTQYRSRINLFRNNFLLGLFHSKKIIVNIENLYFFFNLKHKHLVICFTVKGIRIKAF